MQQLDDALAQYDLDATSCMQLAVCSYVSEAENSVERGGADPSQLIINGLAKSVFRIPSDILQHFFFELYLPATITTSICGSYVKIFY